MEIFHHHTLVWVCVTQCYPEPLWIDPGPKSVNRRARTDHYQNKRKKTKVQLGMIHRTFLPPKKSSRTRKKPPLTSAGVANMRGEQWEKGMDVQNCGRGAVHVLHKFAFIFNVNDLQILQK